MKSKFKMLSALAGVALCSSLFTSPVAAEESSFAMLEGVQAQALSGSEMDSVHGTAVTLAQLDLAFERSLARLKVARALSVTAAREVNLRATWNIIRQRLIALGIR